MSRPALDRDRVVTAAVAVADRDGLGAVSMRRVGAELGVEAMSLYHHVANKEALLDALVDRFFAEIELPASDAPWRDAMAARARSARTALGRHPWALGLIESRSTPLTNLLRHHESVLANLRRNGFSVALAAHAFSAIDAYVHGFVLTELNLPFAPGETDGGAAAETFVASIAEAMPPSEYPYMVEMITAQVLGGGYAYGNEFEFGLDLVLDGLDRARAGSESG